MGLRMLPFAVMLIKLHVFFLCMQVAAMQRDSSTHCTITHGAIGCYVDHAASLSLSCIQVAAMQRDSSTYCDEPEDAAEYAAWRSISFSMDKLQPEVDKILAGGGAVMLIGRWPHVVVSGMQSGLKVLCCTSFSMDKRSQRWTISWQVGVLIIDHYCL
jgi:hypothetical protein